MQSQRTSNRCEQTSERTSEWPSTYVPILGFSNPSWSGGKPTARSSHYLFRHSDFISEQQLTFQIRFHIFVRGCVQSACWSKNFGKDGVMEACWSFHYCSYLKNKAGYTALGAPKHLYKRRRYGPTDGQTDGPSFRGAL